MPPDASIAEFLLAIDVLEQHDVLPIAGGFYDQTAWFVQMYVQWRDEYGSLQVRSATHDAEFYANKHKALPRK